jgi:hypothetical protein
MPATVFRVECTTCDLSEAEPAELVVEDDSPFVRFLEAHARHHRVERRVVLPEGWAVIDGGDELDIPIDVEEPCPAAS